MLLEDINKLISKGETNSLELKRSTAQLKSAGQTLCGFLNGLGGFVLIGITDDKKIIGQEVTDRTKQDISNIIAKIAPIASIEINYIDIGKGNNQVIALHVNSENNLKPYTFDARPYMRVESSTLVMPSEHYQRLIAGNSRHSINWEDLAIDGATIKDLDAEEILRTVRKGIATGRIPDDYPTDDVEETLKRFKLLKNGKPTRAAIILFAREPTTWLPQCKIRLARFRGIDKTAFIDNKQFEGNAFKIIEEAMTFALRYLPISSRFIPDSVERIDEPLFPTDVLREIFVNAIAHRQYNHTGGSISFAIYDDRIEIWSPGIPPFDIPFEQIKTLHESYPRNANIAKIFYYRKLSETWGKGIELIINKCRKMGHPEPEFFERTSGFCVCLKSKQPIGKTGIYKMPELPQGVVLTARQKEIILILQQQEAMKLQDIVNKLTNEIPIRTIQRELMRLKDFGLIEKQGVRGGAVWKLIIT